MKSDVVETPFSIFCQFFPVLWIRIGFSADPDPAFNLIAHPDPDPESQTNAVHAHPDPGQKKSQNIEFLHEKYP
jgi:hypothetical protein